MENCMSLVVVSSLLLMVDSGDVWAMQVSKTNSEPKQSTDNEKKQSKINQTELQAKDAESESDKKNSLGTILERSTRITISPSSSDEKISQLDEQYAEYLSQFLKQFNKAFEKMVNEDGWVLCDLAKDGDIIFTIVEVNHDALRAKLIDMLKKQQADVKDASEVAKIAVAPTAYWGLSEKLSWIPLYLFRKGLMALLIKGAMVPAGLVSLLLLACPDWISTVLLQDILPLAAKHTAVALVDATLKTMQVSQEWYDWTLKFLKNSLIG